MDILKFKTNLSDDDDGFESTLALTADLIPPDLISITASLGSQSVPDDGNTAIPTLYVPITGNTGQFTLSGVVDPNSDLSMADYTVTTADANHTIVAHGDLSGSPSVTLSPAGNTTNFTLAAGIKTIDPGEEDEDAGDPPAFNPTAYINVDLVQLKDFTVSSGNKSVTATPSDNANKELDVEASDAGTATVSLASTVLGSATAYWKIDGSAASPANGTFSAANVTLNGSASNNWTFTATAWLDADHTGNQTPDDPTLTVTVKLYKPKLTLTIFR